VKGYAIYLIYIGIKVLRSPPVQLANPSKKANGVWTYFKQGALSNLSNPKVAIFYFAYLPQFVTADNSNSTETLLILGVLFALLTFIIKVPLGYLAGYFSTWFQSNTSKQV
jgi:threonine/homoserine/homoserine lactone efflux protein